MMSGKTDHLAILFLLALEALYLAVVLHTGDRAHLGVSVVFLATVSWLLYDEQKSKPADQPVPSTVMVLGLVLILICVTACLYLLQQRLDTTEQHPLRLIPMFMLTGVLLFRGGWPLLVQHRLKVLALFFLAGPHLLAWWLKVPDLLAQWSTSMAAYLLWYLGAEVAVQAPYISVSGAVVEITPECAGVDTITYLMGFALLALLMFPVPRRTSWWVVLLAAFIGFATNMVRIATLAVLNAGDSGASFDYWHTSEGSQAFGAAALTVFSVIYWLLQRRWSANPSAVRRPRPRGPGQPVVLIRQCPRVQVS